jgi:hypothetical protein
VVCVCIDLPPHIIMGIEGPEKNSSPSTQTRSLPGSQTASVEVRSSVHKIINIVSLLSKYQCEESHRSEETEGGFVLLLREWNLADGRPLSQESLVARLSE